MQEIFKKTLLWIAILGLSGCGAAHQSVDDDDLLSKSERRDKKVERLFGDSMFKLGDNTDKNKGNGIGVNQYLWRAALDTVSFMSLRSVDPFGGVIITEWYSTPENPQERIKVDILIMDRQIRSDSVRVSIHKQKLDKQKNWVDTNVDPKSITEMEDAILTRARQLKINKM